MSDTVDRVRRSGVEDTTHPAGALPRPPVRLVVILVLLVVATVSWRRGVYYDGGADLVVLAKAALTCAAFALALTAPAHDTGLRHVRAAPAIWLAVYLGLAAASGAIAAIDTLASLVLVARIALLGVVLILVARAYSWRQSVAALVTTLLGVGAVAVITGLPSLAEGRLEGGVPPLSPNALAQVLTVPLIAIAWMCFNRAARWPHVAAVPALLLLVWLTGSRTGLAALLVAIALLALLAERVSVPAFVTTVLAVPGALYVAGWTPLLRTFIERDDARSLMTLNSRTVAWDSAVDYADTTTERLIGAGLTLKQIPVSAMYRDQQILDSTWVSALLQVGMIGAGLLAAFVIAVIVAASRCPRSQRSLLIALVIYLTIVSILESGMFDASVGFIVFFTAALCAYTVEQKGDRT